VVTGFPSGVATRGKAMAKHVALLRAVNVGGRGSLAMAELRKVAEGLGYGEVKTLLQSGNLVFDTRGKTDALERALEAALKQQLGIETDFMVRDARAWRTIIAANPFPDAAKSDPGHLVVMVLKDRVTAQAVAALQESVKGREVIRPAGRELYITYPDGIGRSKLTGSLIERKLDTRGTARNWNTVTKLGTLLAP
jgi:uncharacterized protein (DUF1697 family)